MRFPVKDESGVVGYYELNPFPGCNQLVISNHATIKLPYRGKGLGTAAASMRIEKARILGYDYMIATVVDTNVAQKKIMDKLGWKRLDSFDNTETGNTVIIYGRQL